MLTAYDFSFAKIFDESGIDVLLVGDSASNVMAGHDDVYALLASGYTVLFGSNPQEAADLAAIAYRTSALSLIPVANAMDGFSTSHMLSEALLPEPELLREYLGDPAGRIPCPTVAQEMLFGAKGRVFQLGGFLTRHGRDIPEPDVADLRAFLSAKADEVEKERNLDEEARRMMETARSEIAVRTPTTMLSLSWPPTRTFRRVLVCGATTNE